ncbi:MAG TPA: Ig-like domain-containing protein, partial [Verrucomicrobiae bacterium]|nr:Ig-like domain-containing protein [Verrucomicrobiae bacterium]
SPLQGYTIDDYYHTAAAVIFDGAAPANGAIEVAIPSPEEIYGADHVDFWVAAYHPTLDVQVVEFFVDDVNVGLSRFERTPTQGGVIQHRLVWDAPRPGRHVLQAKSTLGNGTVLVSSRIPFTVENPVNQLPIVSIGSPDDGDTFIEGATVEILAEASDGDGTVSKVELFLNGELIVTQPGPVASYTWVNASAGSHTITARATDNAGGIATAQPVHILVRHREAVAFVHRELPAAYSPGVSFVVELRADPPEGTFAYAVEDRPPTGWVVSEISDDGAFDAINRKVKFGPFLDDSARTLKYRVTPPSNATGIFEFSGSSSVNGATYPITGDVRIELARQYHPADTNQDFRIVLSEVTGYAAAWKAGHSWPTGPVPIPLNYVTRAHHIWQRGETYRFDPAAGAAPACWVTTSGGAGASLAAVGVATRSMFGDMRADAVTQVRVSAAPPTGSSGFAVEERPPYGWTISNISHEGIFDAVAGVIRWGVFSDGVARTLSYSATPPPAVSSVGVFAGQLSFDGKLLLIGADSRFENSVSIDGVAPVQINCEPAPTGFKLNITGPSGQTGVIESSTDFSDWTEVKSIFIPNGAVEFTDESPASERRFYRLRVQ